MTDDRHPHKARNRLFVSAAEELYGKRWGRRVAAGINTPQATIASIATGRRAVTPELELKLATLIYTQFKEWELRLDRLAPLALQLAKSASESRG